MRKLLFLMIAMFQCAIAQNFDFNSKGEIDANNILKEYIQNNFNIEDIDTIGYYYQNKIIGIAKHSSFYTPLEGYKLIALEKKEDNYIPIDSDVIFDNTQEFNIDDNKITFYKSMFYKNKKYHATIKNNEIKSQKAVADVLADRKVKNIASLVQPVKNENVNCFELSDFKTNPERKVNIKYGNLDEKVRNYIEMR